MAAPVDPETRARLLADLIHRRRAGESFEAICATPGWPSRRTLRKWLRQEGLAEAVPALRRRPVRWSRRLANLICQRLACGEGLRELCRDPAMPDRKTLAQWQARRPAFADRMWVARFDGGSLQAGRKTRRTPALLDEIYLRLCQEGVLKHVCAEPGMPNARTVRDWARQSPRFAAALALARQIHHEACADALVGDLRAYLQDLEAECEATRRASYRPRPAGDGGGGPRPEEGVVEGASRSR